MIAQSQYYGHVSQQLPLLLLLLLLLLLHACCMLAAGAGHPSLCLPHT
jgi:hypothetical protein